MAIDQTAVLEKFRLRMAEISGINAAYAASQSSPAAGGIPANIVDFPCAIVLPGKTLAYIIDNGRHRHTYQVRVLVLVTGMDYSENAFNVAPMPDRVIEKFTGNVTLGGSANSSVFRDSSGLSTVEWAGVEYLGYEFIFEVSETAAATVATGS